MPKIFIPASCRELTDDGRKVLLFLADFRDNSAKKNTPEICRFQEYLGAGRQNRTDNRLPPVKELFYDQPTGELFDSFKLHPFVHPHRIPALQTGMLQPVERFHLRLSRCVLQRDGFAQAV